MDHSYHGVIVTHSSISTLSTCNFSSSLFPASLIPDFSIASHTSRRCLLSNKTVIHRCVPTGPARVLPRPIHELYRLVTFQPGDDHYNVATTAGDIEL